MKILCIGDTHFKDSLSYADYVSDRRIAEKKEILDFIIKESSDCEHIVFLGDNFHSKNNSSEVNREFVEFIERFGDKQVYVISGNHEKKGDGKTAIDFLGEVKKKNWHIFTRPSAISIDGVKLDFLPYMLNSELGVENSEEATKYIMNHLDGGDILFTHHNITGTSFNGISTDTLKGVVLPKEELEKKYKLIVAGDIHVPQQYGRVVITGSLFTSEVGELEKFIWKIDPNAERNPHQAIGLYKLKVPNRPIYKLTNPTPLELTKLPKNAILKIIVTDKNISIEELKVVASGLDAYLIIEDYPNERAKMHIEKGAIDFNIESLLKMYSEAKKVDYQKLVSGLELINAEK